MSSERQIELNIPGQLLQPRLKLLLLLRIRLYEVIGLLRIHVLPKDVSIGRLLSRVLFTAFSFNNLVDRVLVDGELPSPNRGLAERQVVQIDVKQTVRFKGKTG